MTRLSQYFRSDIVRCTTGCVPLLTRMVESCTQSKISNFDFHLVIKKNIAQLHISMDDSLPVQILKPLNQLNQVILGLKFSNSDPVPQKF